MVASDEQRYRSLDGLRGIAALTVILYHALLIVPAVSVLYIEKRNPRTWSPEWWLYRTPLRLLMPGHEAVLIFFVLSGFVLMLPLLAKGLTVRRTLAYYARRLIRLYLPVWGAVIFAVVLAEIVKRDPTIGSSWLQTHKPFTFSALAHDVVLLFGTSNLDSPLWSLTWEVWFSLLLPVLYLLIKVARVRDWWLPAMILLALISAVSRFPAVERVLPFGFVTGGLLQYLPVFGLGMVLAIRQDALKAFAARIRVWWLVVLVALVLLVCATYFSTGASYGPDDAVYYLLSLVGVVGVVFIALEGPSVRVFLERTFPQWAGSRSFSIYLVHEPILVAGALLTHAYGWVPWLFIAAALIPVILGVAEVFWRFIENPSKRLSQITGRRITANAPVVATEPAL